MRPAPLGKTPLLTLCPLPPDIKAGNIGSGSGGGFGLNAPGTGKAPKSFAGAGAPKGFIVNDDCKQAWENLCSDKEPTHFVIGKYSSDYKSLEVRVFCEICSMRVEGCLPGWILTRNPSQLAASGEGRLAAFIAALHSNLGDSVIGWGGFRCYGVDDRGNTISKR